MAAFMAASPAPTLVIGPSGMANSRLYKIAPPAIFWCCHAREAGACSGPRMTGVSALQDFAVRGRSHKQSEQFNHTNSDHEHCKCHGIVVQPVQPLLHGTPPCSPTLVSERDPETTPPAALAFPCPPGDSARRPVFVRIRPGDNVTGRAMLGFGGDGSNATPKSHGERAPPSRAGFVAERIESEVSESGTIVDTTTSAAPRLPGAGVGRKSEPRVGQVAA